MSQNMEARNIRNRPDPRLFLHGLGTKLAQTVDELNDLAKDISLKNIAESTNFQQIFSRDDEYQRRTKIIGTIGPACGTTNKLASLIDNGMNIARFNFSHSDHQAQYEKLEMLREAMEITGKDCEVLLDTKGPEIRTGFLGD